jgi:phage host-nuclease inhibitor protein Gam
MPTAFATTSIDFKPQPTNERKNMIMLNETGGSKAKTRIKVAREEIGSQADAENTLLQIKEAENDKRRVTADMDAEKLAAENKYQPQLTDLNTRIETLSGQLAAWAEAHPEIFPKDRKSVKWSGGKFGFRLDTPSLALANRSTSWAKVLAIIAGKKWRRFIRIKREVDRDAVLARCGTKEKPTKFQTTVLPTIGLKLVQEENFFVEPDLTETTTK